MHPAIMNETDIENLKNHIKQLKALRVAMHEPTDVAVALSNLSGGPYSWKDEVVRACGGIDNAIEKAFKMYCEAMERKLLNAAVEAGEVEMP